MVHACLDSLYYLGSLDSLGVSWILLVSLDSLGVSVRRLILAALWLQARLILCLCHCRIKKVRKEKKQYSSHLANNTGQRDYRSTLQNSPPLVPPYAITVRLDPRPPMLSRLPPLFPYTSTDDNRGILVNGDIFALLVGDQDCRRLFLGELGSWLTIQLEAWLLRQFAAKTDPQLSSSETPSCTK